jgi:hypothetical protein
MKRDIPGEELPYMPMDRKDAEKVVEIFLKASALCNDSLRTVMANDSLGQAQVFGRLAGAYMGHSFTNVLAPLWKAFPDLEPPEMKERYVEPAPVLSAASENALRVFLAQAHAALRLVQDLIPPAECARTFSFGGLPEVEEAVVEAERFLALPRYRDEEAR